MTEVAADVADGLLVHSFTTRSYLREVTLPTVTARLAEAGRDRTAFTVCYPGLVATGADKEEFTAAVAAVRGQIAFYGATPSYRPVLATHGWEDLHTELHWLSRRSDWTTMTDLVDDTVLETFAMVGEPAAVGAELATRFNGLVDRFTLATPYEITEQTRHAVVDALRSHLP
jgi:probable F420-dependent oxidoreductase